MKVRMPRIQPQLRTRHSRLSTLEVGPGREGRSQGRPHPGDVGETLGSAAARLRSCSERRMGRSAIFVDELQSLHDSPRARPALRRGGRMHSTDLSKLSQRHSAKSSRVNLDLFMLEGACFDPCKVSMRYGAERLDAQMADAFSDCDCFWQASCHMRRLRDIALPDGVDGVARNSTCIPSTCWRHLPMLLIAQGADPDHSSWVAR
jgi:hypothetical protein